MNHRALFLLLCWVAFRLPASFAGEPPPSMRLQLYVAQKAKPERGREVSVVDQKETAFLSALPQAAFAALLEVVAIIPKTIDFEKKEFVDLVDEGDLIINLLPADAGQITKIRKGGEEQRLILSVTADGKENFYLVEFAPVTDDSLFVVAGTKTKQALEKVLQRVVRPPAR